MSIDYATMVQATEEEVEAQRQWLETGTVPIGYVEGRCDQSMTNQDDPIRQLIRELDPKQRFTRPLRDRLSVARGGR